MVEFTLRDMLLAVLAGGLMGWLTYHRRMQANKERPFARLIGAVLEPLFYWLDLKGHDGRPSRSKVSYAFTLFVMLFGIIWFGMHLTAGLTWPYNTYVGLVALYSLGPQAFWTFLSTKLGDNLGQVLRARAGLAPLPNPEPK